MIFEIYRWLFTCYLSVRNIFWTEPDVNSGPVILAYIIVVLVLVRFNPSAVTQITCAGLLYWFREDFMSKGTNNAIRSCIQDNAIWGPKCCLRLLNENQVLGQKSNNRSYTRYHSKDSLLITGVNCVYLNSCFTWQI